MADPRKCFLGNMPDNMCEVTVKQHIDDLGFVVPLKVVVRTGRTDHQDVQYGIATFQKASDCRRLMAKGFYWPNGKYCLIK